MNRPNGAGSRSLIGRGEHGLMLLIRPPAGGTSRSGIKRLTRCMDCLRKRKKESGPVRSRMIMGFYKSLDASVVPRGQEPSARLLPHTLSRDMRHSPCKVSSGQPSRKGRTRTRLRLWLGASWDVLLVSNGSRSRGLRFRMRGTFGTSHRVWLWDLKARAKILFRPFLAFDPLVLTLLQRKQVR